MIPFPPNKGKTVLSEGLHESQGHDTTASSERDPSDFGKFAKRSVDRKLLVNFSRGGHKYKTHPDLAHTHKNEAEKEPDFFHALEFLNGPQRNSVQRVVTGRPEVVIQ